MKHNPPGSHHPQSHLLTLSRSTTRSSVHSPTPLVLQTTSGTDYATSSPPYSPPPVLGVVPSIRMSTAHMYLIRTPPEPEYPAVGTALRYYKHVPEDEDEVEREEQEDLPPGEMEELGETKKGTRSKLKTDWKSNPHANPGKRKTRRTPRIRHMHLQVPPRLCGSSRRRTNLPSGSTKTRFGLRRGYRRWSSVGESGARWRYSSELLTSRRIVEMYRRKY